MTLRKESGRRKEDFGDVRGMTLGGEVGIFGAEDSEWLMLIV